MLGYLPKRDLIFFVPGKSGAVFALSAKQPITLQQLLKTQEFLAHQTNSPVVYMEERRAKHRL